MDARMNPFKPLSRVTLFRQFYSLTGFSPLAARPAFSTVPKVRRIFGTAYLWYDGPLVQRGLQGKNRLTGDF
jgi:hypothetical protein